MITDIRFWGSEKEKIQKKGLRNAMRGGRVFKR